MSFILRLKWEDIVNLLGDAKSNIYVAAPSIDDVFADGLLRAHSRGVKISVCIDNSEAVVRNGYGEEKGIVLLKDTVLLKEAKGNRVSFIIADMKSFIYFPESKVFSEEPEGYNAIEIDPVFASRLINYYFPPKTPIEKDELIQRMETGLEFAEKTLEEIVKASAVQISEPFNENTFRNIQDQFKKNPPEHPDLTRKVKTYNSKIQFVEFESEGLNIEHLTLKFPKDAMPINDPVLRQLLQARLKAFEDINIEKEVPDIAKIKKSIEKLRNDFLKPITLQKR